MDTLGRETASRFHSVQDLRLDGLEPRALDVDRLGGRRDVRVVARRRMGALVRPRPDRAPPMPRKLIEWEEIRLRHIENGGRFLVPDLRWTGRCWVDDSDGTVWIDNGGQYGTWEDE